MNLNQAIDFNQLKTLMTQCKMEEKIEMIQMREKETFPIRFKPFLNQTKTDDLNSEEMTAEIKIVREKRYRAKKSYSGGY